MLSMAMAIHTAVSGRIFEGVRIKGGEGGNVIRKICLIFCGTWVVQPPVRSVFFLSDVK